MGRWVGGPATKLIRQLPSINPVVNSRHQILKVGENMGVGLMPVLGHHLAVDYNVELAMGAWGELKAGDVFTGPAQCFFCHPGSTQRMASILAVKNLQVHLFRVGQGTSPTGVLT